jgi:hypothetical protein
MFLTCGSVKYAARAIIVACVKRFSADKIVSTPSLITTTMVRLVRFDEAELSVNPTR